MKRILQILIGRLPTAVAPELLRRQCSFALASKPSISLKGSCKKKVCYGKIRGAIFWNLDLLVASKRASDDLKGTPID